MRPDDGDLLRVLLAEVRALGAHDVEELQADGRDAAEVARAERALSAARRALDVDPRAEAGRVDLRDAPARRAGRRPPPRRSAASRLLVPRVRGEVGVLAELRRVDEQAARRPCRILARAARKSATWPSCSAPIVGTRPTSPCARAQPGDRPRSHDRHAPRRLRERDRRAPRARARRPAVRARAPRPSPSRRARSGRSARSRSRSSAASAERAPRAARPPPRESCAAARWSVTR